MIVIAIIVTIKLNISKKGNSICAGHCIENSFGVLGQLAGAGLVSKDVHVYVLSHDNFPSSAHVSGGVPASSCVSHVPWTTIPPSPSSPSIGGRLHADVSIMQSLSHTKLLPS